MTVLITFLLLSYIVQVAFWQLIKLAERNLYVLNEDGDDDDDQLNFE